MKYICLSFDDGPNIQPGDNTMNDMLDIMEKNNVPGSFFLIGNKITEENKKVILRAVKMGCDIQNHSWTHPFMDKLSIEEIKDEYKKCDDAITDLVGKRPEFFRPPFVAVKQEMYDAITVPFICGVGVNDWDPNYDENYRYEQMIKSAQNGTIFLLHVLEGNKATLKAVERAIPVLKEQGFTFVNLPDLFEKCGVNPAIKNSLWSVAGDDVKGNSWPR